MSRFRSLPLRFTRRSRPENSPNQGLGFSPFRSGEKAQVLQAPISANVERKGVSEREADQSRNNSGEQAMNHQLRFRADGQLDLQITGKPRLEQVKVRAGEVIEAQVRPYVMETSEGPVEFADLQLGDEGTLVNVRMEY